LQAAGVISRNMGDALAFCPPLIISDGEVDDLLERFGRALNATLDALPAGTVK
jgi:4-aminobutyrate--pyruvate transaminase